jgi:ketosteroid isomerase-like protein
MRKLVWFVVFPLISLVGSAGQSSPEAEKEEVRKTLSEFITAFDNLDWERFRAAFADDATVFYPREFANRASGRTEVEENFRYFFELIRAGRTKPP